MATAAESVEVDPVETPPTEKPRPVLSGSQLSNADLLRSSMHLDAEGKPLKHGQHPCLQPREPALVATLSYKSFAPCPCICVEVCNNMDAKSRVFARVYENQLAINNPWNPCCCCGPSCCTVDDTELILFDNLNKCKLCFNLPCPCFGPPAVYVYVPKFCYCIDCQPCFGRTIYHSPCNCHGLRSWCCCGVPCFMLWARPLTFSSKGGNDWLPKFRKAHNEFSDKHNLPEYKRARFYKVVDIGLCDCGTNRQVDTYPGDIPHNEVMER